MKVLFSVFPLKLRSLGSPHKKSPDPKISWRRPPIYHTGRVWSPERGGTPPPGRGPASSPPYGGCFRVPGFLEGPRSLSRELWGFGGRGAAGPPGHGIFRGNPPMVSGGGRGPAGAVFGGPGPREAISSPIWSRRNGINFSSYFSGFFIRGERFSY